MRVLFLAPAYPAEMPHFVRGLAEVGAHVIGVGEGPVSAVAQETRRYLGDYLQVPRLFDEDDLVRRVVAWAKAHPVDRVEALWEPLVIAAARIREALDMPGMSVDTAALLEARGHTVQSFDFFSSVQVIHQTENGEMLAASDPRKGGWPAGLSD